MTKIKITGVMPVILAVLMVAAVFCLSSQVFAESGWTGTWQSDWGDMSLKQDGDTVTGTYTHKEGTISGKLSDGGKVLKGTWTQAPTHKPDNDAGAFIFTLSDDGKTFTGTWWYGSDTSKDPDGTWRGTRK